MKRLLKIFILVFGLILLAELAFMIYTINLAKETLAKTEVTLNNIKSSEELLADLIVKPTEVDVIFTNFIGTQLGSGINPTELSVNDQGLVTYQNKVVIATATYECLNSSYGACRHIKDVPNGYLVFNYFDEMIIEYDGIKYKAIVLDSCGSCSVDKGEDYQRFDILVASDYDFTKILGNVILSN